MPRGDRTGPQGMGPMTGRGMGYCAGYDAPGYMNPAFGRGAGFGYGRGFRGGGRGWRNMYYATGMPGWARYGYAPAWGMPPAAPAWSAEDETAALKQQAEMLQETLNDINRRLDELSKTEE